MTYWSTGGSEDGDWYEVILFSGVTRYVYKSLVEPTEFEPVVPTERDALQGLYDKFLWVEKRSTRIADEEVPWLTFEESISFGPIAEDITWKRLEKEGDNI